MIKIPRGTQDILPEDSAKWRYIENKLDGLMELYNYKEIHTPIFESTELFARGVGNSTDVVQKEMYTFKDKGERSLTLRPEGPNKENFKQKFNRQSKLGFVAGVRSRIQYEFCLTLHLSISKSFYNLHPI